MPEKKPTIGFFFYSNECVGWEKKTIALFCFFLWKKMACSMENTILWKFIAIFGIYPYQLVALFWEAKVLYLFQWLKIKCCKSSAKHTNCQQNDFKLPFRSFESMFSETFRFSIVMLLLSFGFLIIYS